MTSYTYVCDNRPNSLLSKKIININIVTLKKKWGLFGIIKNKIIGVFRIRLSSGHPRKFSVPLESESEEEEEQETPEQKGILKSVAYRQD